MEDCYPQLKKSKLFTDDLLKKIRDKLSSVLEGLDGVECICIVSVGSFARGEASDESDLDMFLIADSINEAHKSICEKVDEVVSSIITKPTGSTEVFGAKEDNIELFNCMVENLGGPSDSNKKLTRRMLLLLEGTFLFNEEKFNEYRLKLLQEYFKEKTPDKKLNRFFLNDIIRYYRTIATDFEYKTHEKTQSWGVRNIKLRFSRKLIYFSGIVVVARTSNGASESRINAACAMLSMTPIERVKESISDSRKILTLYNSFLQSISEKSVRDRLNTLTKDNYGEDEEFCLLRENAKEFSKALESSLKATYNPEHEIHHALLF